MTLTAVSSSRRCRCWWSVQCPFSAYLHQQQLGQGSRTVLLHKFAVPREEEQVAIESTLHLILHMVQRLLGLLGCTPHITNQLREFIFVLLLLYIAPLRVLSCQAPCLAGERVNYNTAKRNVDFGRLTQILGMCPHLFELSGYLEDGSFCGFYEFNTISTGF